jgi:hypothetical protein
MPIRPDLRRFYGRDWRRVVRPRILARAGNKCEECGKPDREHVETVTYAARFVSLMWWRSAGRRWTSAQSVQTPREFFRNKVCDMPPPRSIRVILTVAQTSARARIDPPVLSKNAPGGL